MRRRPEHRPCLRVSLRERSQCQAAEFPSPERALHPICGLSRGPASPTGCHHRQEDAGLKPPARDRGPHSHRGQALAAPASCSRATTGAEGGLIPQGRGTRRGAPVPAPSLLGTGSPLGLLLPMSPPPPPGQSYEPPRLLAGSRSLGFILPGRCKRPPGMLNSISAPRLCQGPRFPAGFRLLSAPLPVSWRPDPPRALGLNVVSTQKQRGWLHRPLGPLHPRL